MSNTLGPNPNAVVPMDIEVQVPRPPAPITPAHLLRLARQNPMMARVVLQSPELTGYVKLAINKL